MSRSRNTCRNRYGRGRCEYVTVDAEGNARLNGHDRTKNNKMKRSVTHQIRRAGKLQVKRAVEAM